MFVVDGRLLMWGDVIIIKIITIIIFTILVIFVIIIAVVDIVIILSKMSSSAQADRRKLIVDGEA